MLNEASNLLFAIAGVSASFVAILGGFIASKLITINSERDIAESNLEEVKYQKFLKTEERDMLRHSLNEEDSLFYVYNHFEELSLGVALKDVYKTDAPQVVDFETLLPYWEKALFYARQYEECLQKEKPCLNVDGVPSKLAEDNKDDAFIYKFLIMYAEWNFSDEVENLSSLTQTQWHEKTRELCMQANMQAAALDIQEQRYKMDLNRARKPKGMKIGLLIFALFSLFNIIIPLIFSVIALSEQWCEVVMYGCIGTLSIGLGAIFLYLSLMLKPKSLKSEAKDIKKELNI